MYYVRVRFGLKMSWFKFYSFDIIILYSLGL